MVVIKYKTYGLNRIRDLLSTDLTKAQLGTDNTVPKEEDTGLVTPIGGTKLSTTYSTADGELTVSYTLDNATGLNQTYKEFALLDVNENVFSRIVFNDYDHDSSKTLTIRKRLFFRNART